jgi:hypothetical protein
MLTLMAINRTRSDPNNIAANTKAACSQDYPAQKPLVLSYDGSRASRFHCQNLMVNQCGLSHNSYCTLKTDIAATNCDGSDSCACVAGTEAFNCTTLGGNGTNPFVRDGYFGFSANGEVGAAGYGDGWAANLGWVTECAGSDGHRSILTGGDKDTIGLGYARGSGCWPTYHFGDTANQGIVTPVLPSGVAKLVTGTSFDFYVSYHDPAPTPAPPTSIYAVIDGACHAMTEEIGVSAANLTYKFSLAVGGGCHEYWFLARDSRNARSTWPEQGSWGVGSCSSYNATSLPADCETVPADAGQPGPDASAPGRDAAVPPGLDASSIPGADAAVLPGEDAAAVPGEDASVAPGEDAAAVPGEDASVAPGEDAGVAPGEDAAATPGEDATTAPGQDGSASAGEDAAATPGVDATSLTVRDAAQAGDSSTQGADAQQGSDAAGQGRDTGSGSPEVVESGCGCSAGAPSQALWALAAAIVLLRRRGKPTSPWSSPAARPRPSCAASRASAAARSPRSAPPGRP